jgi:hypothetical protein
MGREWNTEGDDNGKLAFPTWLALHETRWDGRTQRGRGPGKEICLEVGHSICHNLAPRIGRLGRVKKCWSKHRHDSREGKQNRTMERAL